MNWVKNFINRDPVDFELLYSTSRKVVLTTSAIYILWHIVATLGFPTIFSPSLWLCTLVMIITVGLTLFLMPRRFRISQAVWFCGLSLTVITAFILYGRAEITLVFLFLPMMAEVMMGLQPTIVLEGCILFMVLVWNGLPFLPILPVPYMLGVGLGSIFSAMLGWGLSNNLISAIEASNYHYAEAIKRLEETRQHRAEISTLLKEVNKANFQLDRLNQMLSHARARAEEAREERDRFALAVSHELRSPLNFIIGFSDLMVNSPETYADPQKWPAGLYEDIREIYHSSTHLLALINDILDMGKIDAQQMTLFKEKVDLSRIFDEVAEMVRPAIEKKNLYFHIEVDPQLAPLYVDHTRIRQVLLNLLTNSLRFTSRGGITLRGYRKNDNFVQVEVSDTGEGISSEDLPKVFSEFRQAGNQNWQRREGTGLGLFIGKRFIQLHGGEMGVKSILGQGSMFYFTLPLEDSHETSLSELNLNMNAAQSSPVSAPAQPLLLFLVKDHFWARNFAESISGYKFSLVKEPDQLYNLTSQFYPWAVIIDSAMLQNSAVEAFIKNPPYDVPIITLPIPLNINRITTLPEGVSSYLVKPVPRQKLLNTLAALNRPIKQLLVVDDDDTMVRFVSQTLRSSVSAENLIAFEISILTAVNGQEALEYLNSVSVDAVLLDLDLPDMNGLNLIEIMQKDERLKRVPIIIVSANDLSPSIHPVEQAYFRVSLNRLFYQKELAALLSSSLASVSPTYPEDHQKSEDGETRKS
ncbi:MAG: ATP-binding protein [Anaerolineae bacterium]|nr:ATP-binding protein [Anaerolineae bacterium]